MALSFDGTPIKGTHGPIVVGGPEPNLRRVRFWHVKGEGEIVGKNFGRSLYVRIILHDRYAGAKPTKLLQKLDELDNLVGKNGNLKETGNMDRQFQNCTLEGYEPVPLPGQEEAGPLLDFGGLNAGGQPDNGWWICVVLRFRQLLVD